MEIFREMCFGEDYFNNKQFLEWHKVIKADLSKFKIILDQYDVCEEKNKLLVIIDNIRRSIMNGFDSGSFILMKSTIEYFLFSFYDEVNNDMPTYVLLSRDYKRFLIASEVMECFDDPQFAEDERYGIYRYDYFFLKDNKVKHYDKEIKEYTTDYSSKFDNSYFYMSNIEKSEEYYDSLLNEQNIVKKLSRIKV